MLPSFLVIGGMKCGTSALYEHLIKHPSIFISKKNIDFFNDECWPKGLEWYKSFFPESETTDKIIGEISTEYTKAPHRAHVPERISETLPNVRLIYLVRHPIKRMISQYIHCINNLSESRPIELALKPSGDNPYVNTSLYYMQLELYLNYYNKENILILKSEDLLKQPRNTLDKMFEFIHAPLLDNVEKLVVHTHNEKRKWNTVGRHIRQSQKRFNLFNYYQRRLPKKVAEMLLWATSRPIEINGLPHNLLRDLIDHIKSDTEKLYTFAGPNFKHWELEKI